MLRLSIIESIKDILKCIIMHISTVFLCVICSDYRKEKPRLLNYY
jgi:hypothetical protein